MGAVGLLGEDETSYTVLTDAGVPQRLAKGGLTPDVVAQVQALPLAPGAAMSTPTAPAPSMSLAPAPTLTPAPGGPPAPPPVDTMPAVDMAPNAPVHGAMVGASGQIEGLAPTAPPPREKGPPETLWRPEAAQAPAPQPPGAQLIRLPGGGGGAGKTQGAYLDTFKKQGQATSGQAYAQAEGERKKSEALSRASVDTMMQEQEMRDRQVQQQNEVDKEITTLKTMQADLASSKIDANHFWASKSTGGKVLAGISLALGELGQGLRSASGPSAAFSIIQSAIERDIETQKANLTTKQAAVENQRQLVGLTRQKFADEETAEAAARELAWKGVQMQVESIASSSKSEEIKAQAQALNAQIDRERLGAQMKFQQASAKAAANRLRYAVNVDGSPVLMTGKDYVAYQQKQRELDIKEGAASGKGEKLKVAGYEGFAPDAERARAFTKQAVAGDRIIKIIGDIKKLRKETSGAELLLAPQKLSANKSKLSALKSAFFTEIKAYQGSGAQLSQQEAEVIQQFMGDPTSIFKSSDVQLDQAAATINQGIQAHAERIGLTPSNANAQSVGTFTPGVHATP